MTVDEADIDKERTYLNIKIRRYTDSEYEEVMAIEEVQESAGV